MLKSCHSSPGFTLVEVLTVIAILSVLCAVLLPVFGTVRGKARQITCVSNLRSVGSGLAIYMQDYDGFFPHAVDPIDRSNPSLFAATPEFAANISRISLLHEVLLPYVNSRELFSCPSDTGFDSPDFSSASISAHPSSYSAFGTSYYYRTGLAALHIHEASLHSPSETNIIFDENGLWHGTLTPITSRYDVLFGDGHVKNINRTQIDTAWATPLIGE